MQTRRFFFITLILCSLSLGIKIFLNSYTLITVDEFWFAHRIYQYRDGIPYRDFAPYKTILGYYLLLIPMLFSHGILSTLIFTKNSIALLNACILFGSAFWLKRFFTPTAILLSLSLLIFSEMFLAYSSDIRVDLLGYWLCFIALLWLLENRYILAGCFIALGFLTTQKAIWYLFAANMALGLQWLIINRRTKMLINIVTFNLIAGFIILVYLAFFSYLTSWHTVIENVFLEASAMYHLDWYASGRAFFWRITLNYNPLLFLLWPFTLISLLVTYQNDKTYKERLFAISTGLTILFCLIPYKQVFPYYMQVTFPALLLMYTAFFTWLFGLKNNYQNARLLVSPTSLWLMLILYILILMYVVNVFYLPQADLLICLIAIAIVLLINAIPLLFNLIISLVLIMGLCYPIPSFIQKTKRINGAYQKANLIVMKNLLSDGSQYVAGIELIYNQNQPIPGMRHLMGPALSYLYKPTKKLRAVMLPSLYEDPNATQTTIIDAWQKSNVKFYVNNYRMHSVPKKIKDYLNTQYQHFWGSIYLYAPQFKRDDTQLLLKFSGNYQLEAHQPIELNQKTIKPNSIIYLKHGTYQLHAMEIGRLKLMPSLKSGLLNPDFSDDSWGKIIF